MNKYNFYVFHPDESLLKKNGFNSVAHVPVIFDSGWSYHREASRFLRERATPTSADVEAGTFRTTRQPTRASLKTFAAQIVNFLEWCAARGRDWKTLEYARDIVDGYEHEMATGSFTADGHPLENSTINQRVDTACSFLLWAMKKGLREPFEIPTITRTYLQSDMTSTHARVIEYTTRANKRRLKPKDLQIPTDEQVGKWLNSVRLRYGRTKALIIALILNTGIRRQEAVEWRLDTLPDDRSKWREGNVAATNVVVTIEHGAKGGKRVKDDEEVGPPRSIVIPMALADRLWHYMEFERPKLLKMYIKSGKTKTEQEQRRRNPPQQVFLSDFTGMPVSAQKLYEAWASAPSLPYEGWSPHLGRHYWACKTLLLELERMRTKFRLALETNLPINWITGSAIDIIQLKIKPQLGHIDKKITEMYLTWVRDVYDIIELHNAYALELGEFTSEETE
jgi:integrase